jgi:hypothetical protein
MFFDSKALPSRPVTGFHWLKPTQSFGPSASRHRSTKRPCSTLHGAGLGSRPGSFEQPIPFPRQRTLNHCASLFFYKIARTTLLCRWNFRYPTQCNCCIIASIRGSRAVQKAGTSRRNGAYSTHSAARRRASASSCLRFPRPHCRPLTSRPDCCEPASGKPRS